MSLEAALSANTDAINKLIEVWSKLTSKAKEINKGAEEGTVTAVTAGDIRIELPAQETVAETVAPKTVTTPAASPVEPATAPTAAASPSEAPAVVTYEEVKQAILNLAKAKGGPVTKDMLSSFGAKTGQDLIPEEYAAVLAHIKALLA